MFNQFLSLALILGLTLGLDCSAKELQPYNFEAITGTHSLINLKDTPPSKTNNTWYFGICQNLQIDKCSKNSDICGITTINIDSNSIISEIIDFNSNLVKSYQPLQDDKGIIITYTGANWGDDIIDAVLTFNCDLNGDDKFNLKSYTSNKLDIEINSKAGCLSNKLKNPKVSPPSDGESWGWFTWIFIFLVLFLSIYIIGGAWFQYNRGNSIDFQSALREVFENFFDILKSLPNFIKEILEKITGNNNRGEYSAV